MRGSVRRSDRLWRWVAAVWLIAAPGWAAPQRVVSMNLCTDQLAMLIAAPGQLISVSDLATDPRMSPIHEQARDYVTNHGRAEEIYLMRPDLVLAGQFASGPTVAMLRRLGLRVEVLAPAESIASIRDDIRHIGTLLGREAAAEQLLDRFDRRLARLRAELGRDRGRVALYYANGITSGTDTLAGTILSEAGFDNIARDYGITTTAALPMELVVMARPDRLIAGAKWPGQSRSEAILDHPALARVAPRSDVTDRDWICGTPFILDAIANLQ